MKNQALAARRRAQRSALIDEKPQPDRFEVAPLRLVRDAVLVQSARAIDLAKVAGLETPCARPTT